MKKIIVVILAVILIAGVCAAPAAAAGKALTHDELYEMINTADFICDMHYGDEFDGRAMCLVMTLSRMFPESERYQDDKHVWDYVFVTEEQLWAGINARWSGASEAMIKKMFIPDVLYEADNGHYVIYFPARGGFNFYKDSAKGEFIGYTANDDGTYSIYFKVPLPDEEVEISALDDLAEELEWPDFIEYNGTTYINNWQGYSTIKYENRVFKFKLTNGETDYISDEWVTKLPDNLDHKLTYVPADIYVDAKTATAGCGDINMDKEVNNKDVVALFRFVSGAGGELDKTAADCNGDGSVDNKDVVILFRHVSGQEVELKYGTEPGYPVASNDKLSTWFSEEIKLDPETWDVLAPEGFDSVSEFVIRRARAKYIEEVTVLKVAEGGSLEDVKAMAEYRCAKEKNSSDYTLYDDDEHRNAKMLDKGVVEVIGNFVVYIVTEDTPTSVARAKNYVAANPDCSALELYKAIVIEE